ncbi:MAG: glycosyltransferase, partial [Rhizonema sp. PD38]|nr:glycosyltransferase [Rhizonema sp. PD38]
MNIVSRIQFPQTDAASELYFKVAQSSTDFYAGARKVVLHKGSKISFDTYFNSFYENFYTKYTILQSLYYLLKLEGEFEINIYRESNQGGKKELLLSHKFQQCQLSDYVKFSLPELKQDQEAGRIYLEIICLSEQGLFTEGLVVTEQEKQRDVSLGIVTCTFKKEVYVKNTVNAILQDSLLQDKQFKVFVVDNGKTLNRGDFESDKVKLISNRNVGGAGGFTKGLIEALQEGIYTHFLFMDDDIELDSEVIYRLFSLYEYAKQDLSVSGSMLDFYKKHMLYEAGAVYNKYFDKTGNLQYYPFEITSIKQNLDLRSSSTLNLLLSEESIDYGAFWFFSFSKEVIENIGLPFPFFMKIDDIEFGLRVKQYLDNRIVAFPSFAVWHEPFYAKKPVWDVYYCTRNQLITNSIHDSLTYLRTIKILTKCIIYNLLRFDYN